MPGDWSYERPGALSAEEVLALVQELVDDRPVGEKCPIEWAVPAFYLGDMSALAALSLRDEITHP